MFRKLSPVQIALDVVLAFVLFGLGFPFATSTLLNWMVGAPDSSPGIVGVVGGLISCGLIATAVAFRRASPPIALMIAWAGAIAQMGFVQIPGLIDVGILMVLYATSAYGSRKTMWWGMGSAAGGSLVAAIYLPFALMALAGGHDHMTAPEVWQAEVVGMLFTGILVFIACVASMGLAWASGLLMRQRVRSQRMEQERAVAQALMVMEQQRSAIARDMHDVVAHSLAVVIAQADGARYAASTDPDVAPEALQTISTTARAALTDVRLLLAQLRHSQAKGPQPTLADLEGLYQQVREAGVELRVQVDPVARLDPPAAIQLAVYRIIQEALTNALRHGDGAAVDVGLAWHPHQVQLRVQNGLGEGMNLPAGGHGLIGMRERAHLVGGRLDAGTHGETFLVTAMIPLPPEAT